jgi:hypothetical protein
VDANAALFEPIHSTRPALRAGGGIWLPITPRVGVRADARFLRARSDSASRSFETWQTTVGATIRF